jgi:hypothetical protein
MNASPFPGSEFDNEFEGDDLESLLSDDNDIAQTVAITFDASSGHGSLTVGKASELISGNEGFGSDCSYRIEYGTVKKDSSRHAIVVSFEGKSKVNDARLMRSFLEVKVVDKDGKSYTYPIPQESKWVNVSLEGGIFFICKDMPNKVTLSGLVSVLTKGKHGKRSKSLVEKVKGAEYFKHKGSDIKRGMVAGYVYLHEDDPQGLKLPGLLSWPWSKKDPNGPRARFVFGFVCRTCTCCGKKGHLASVCKWWAPHAKGQKRKYDESLGDEFIRTGMAENQASKHCSIFQRICCSKTLCTRSLQNLLLASFVMHSSVLFAVAQMSFISLVAVKSFIFSSSSLKNLCYLKPPY